MTSLTSILNPINDAVAWVITRLFYLLSPVFGATSGVTWLLAIMLLVVLIRLIMVPLFIKQMHTQRAMTALSPRISELRKKYKGDKEKLNAETMKLYQEAGVNPLMGCLPLVLQMPIFFALFDVLRFIADWKQGTPLQYNFTEHVVHSAQQAQIFGATISDKVLFTQGVGVPLHAKVVIVVTVMISMATTYLTVRQSQKRGIMPSSGDKSAMGQSQKMMAYFMPLFALTGLYWQFGLVLYWVTTNLWTLGQQFVLLRKYPIGAMTLGSGGTVADSGSGKARSASGGTGTSAGKVGGAGKGGAGKTGNGRPTGTGAANGHKPAGGAGKPRLFGKRSEPETKPAEPETKIVRQQRQRQSRSKRTGKR